MFLSVCSLPSVGPYPVAGCVPQIARAVPINPPSFLLPSFVSFLPSFLPLQLGLLAHPLPVRRLRGGWASTRPTLPTSITSTSAFTDHLTHRHPLCCVVLHAHLASHCTPARPACPPAFLLSSILDHATSVHRNPHAHRTRPPHTPTAHAHPVRLPHLHPIARSDSALLSHSRPRSRCPARNPSPPVTAMHTGCVMVTWSPTRPPDPSLLILPPSLLPPPGPGGRSHLCPRQEPRRWGGRAAADLRRRLIG